MNRSVMTFGARAVVAASAVLVVGCGTAGAGAPTAAACPGGPGCEPAAVSGPAPSAVAFAADATTEGAAAVGGSGAVQAGRPAACSVAVTGLEQGRALREAAEREIGDWLRQCAADSGLTEARLSVQFAVGSTGCAEQVSIRAEPADERLAACVAVGFYALRLPTAKASEAMAIRFPLVISAPPH